MPGIGTVYVELDLSSKEYTKREREILEKSKQTTLTIEDNWRTLGSHSDALFQAQKQSFINAYDSIKNNSRSTVNEIIRAEELKNEKIKALNNEQHGHQKTLTSDIQNLWSKVGLAVAGYFSFQFIKGQLNSAIESFKTAEQVEIRLTTALKNQGLVAREYTQDMIDLAQARQNLTRFSDEETISAEALLIMNGKNLQQVKELIPLVQDLAEASAHASGGMKDLEGTTRILVQALDGEFGQLGRMGIKLSDVEEKYLKNLNAADRYNGIIKLLNKSIGGLAETMGTSLSGQMEILNNKLDDQYEKLGGKVLPAWLAVKESFLWIINRAADVAGGIAAIAEAAGIASVQMENLGEKDLGKYMKKSRGATGSWEEIKTPGAKIETGSKKELTEKELQAELELALEIMKINERNLADNLEKEEKAGQEKIKSAKSLNDINRKINEVGQKENQKIRDNELKQEEINDKFRKDLRIGEVKDYIKSMQEKAKIREDFDKQLNSLGKSQFDLERQRLEEQKQAWIQAGVDRESAEKVTSEKIKGINEAEKLFKIQNAQQTASMMSNAFAAIAQRSQAAFVAYKAASIIEAMINAHLAASKALAQLGIFGPLAAVIIYAAGVARAQSIAAMKTPSYDDGGISRGRGYYQTGNIDEAHIPLKSGKVPVKIEREKIINNNNTETIHIQIDLGNEIIFDKLLKKSKYGGNKIIAQRGIL